MMTYLAIISDIHGNLPALEAVMADMAQYPIDQVVVAGDAILGPFSEQVVECILEKKWQVIQGNYETNLCASELPQSISDWGAPIDYPITGWLKSHLSVSLVTAIANWPECLHLEYPRTPSICVFHGSPRDQRESLYSTMTNNEIERIVAQIEEPYLITGHTHLILDRRVGRLHLINPGSVGMPLDGQLAASYVVMKAERGEWYLLFRRVPYDVTPVLREFDRQGFIESCGVVGALLYESFRTAHQQGGFLRWRKEHNPDIPVSMELLMEYRQSCQWWEYVDPVFRVGI